MNILDPQRERLPNGRPLYHDDFGPVAAIPKLSIDVNPPNVEISVMLLDSPNCGRWYETTVPMSTIEHFFVMWYNDPEYVLRHVFKWPGMLRKPPVAATVVDISKWAALLGDVP